MTTDTHLPPTSGSAIHWPLVQVRTFITPEARATLRTYAAQTDQTLQAATAELLQAGMAARGLVIGEAVPLPRRTRYTPEQLAALAAKRADIARRREARAAKLAEADARREAKRIAREAKIAAREAELAARPAKRSAAWAANMAKARAARAAKRATTPQEGENAVAAD